MICINHFSSFFWMFIKSMCLNMICIIIKWHLDAACFLKLLTFLSCSVTSSIPGYGSHCWSCVHPIYHYILPLKIKRTTGANFDVKLTTELLPSLLLATFQERFLPAWRVCLRMYSSSRKRSQVVVHKKKQHRIHAL